LTSTRRAWFTYGTNLPDLALGMAERAVNGLDYVFTLRMENSGKTAAAATTVVFSDNDVDVQSAARPPPWRPGAYQERPVQLERFGQGRQSHAALYGRPRQRRQGVCRSQTMFWK